MSQEQSWKEPKWVSDFQTDTAKWHKALLDTDPCLVCGCHPDLILQVSKLIPVELKLAYEVGKEEGQQQALGYKEVAIRQESRTYTLKECIEIGEKERVEMKETHACRFNDGKQNCDCYLQALSDYQQQLKKLL